MPPSPRTTLLLIGALGGCAGAPSAAEQAGAAHRRDGGRGASGGDAGARRRVDLVSPHDWEFMPAARDPFADERPVDRTCDLTAIAVDGEVAPVFEIRTEICNYATVGQASIHPVLEGDVIEIVLSHNPLRAQESAEAFAAVRLAEEAIWAARVPIPGDAQSYRTTWTAPRAYPQGTPVFLHIDNHGTNSWRLLSITTGPPDSGLPAL